MEKLSGKLRESVKDAINEVIDASCIEEISNCRKIETLNSVYRIRIGSRRHSLSCTSKLKATSPSLNILYRAEKLTTRRTWSV